MCVVGSCGVKGTGKVRYLQYCFLHETDLWPEAIWQSWKWQLIGMS